MSHARKFSLLSIAAIAVAAIVGASAPAQARTNVDVDLFFRTGSPSHGGSIYVDFDSRPEYVRIPESRVRYVRGGDCDVYFYSGWYYAYDDGYWYRSRDWDGPWFFVRYNYVPRQVIYVPERYHPRWVNVRENRHVYRPHDYGRHRGWHKGHYYRSDDRHDSRDRNEGWRDPRFDRNRDSNRNDNDRDNDRGYNRDRDSNR